MQVQKQATQKLREVLAVDGTAAAQYQPAEPDRTPSRQSSRQSSYFDGESDLKEQ